MHDAKVHPGDGFFLSQWLLNQSTHLSNHTITLTNSTRKKGISQGIISEENSSVVPHGLFPYYSCKIPRTSHNFRVLFAGRIQKYKGLDILLKAWPLVRTRLPKATLHICGSGDISPYKNFLKNDPSLVITNKWISDQEFEVAFRDADLCVLPYIEASQSGVIPSAFAAAMPVIVTPQQGLLEQIASGGGLACQDATPSSLAKAILEVLSNSQVYERLSREALQVGQSLEWNILAKEVRKIITDHAP